LVKLKKGKWKDVEVTLREMEVGEDHDMRRKASKYSVKGVGRAATPSVDVDPWALVEWRVFYSIESPASLKNMEEIKKLKKSDFELIVREIDKLYPLVESEDKSEEQAE